LIGLAVIGFVFILVTDKARHRRADKQMQRLKELELNYSTYISCANCWVKTRHGVHVPNHARLQKKHLVTHDCMRCRTTQKRSTQKPGTSYILHEWPYTFEKDEFFGPEGIREKKRKKWHGRKRRSSRSRTGEGKRHDIRNGTCVKCGCSKRAIESFGWNCSGSEEEHAGDSRTRGRLSRESKERESERQKCARPKTDQPRTLP